MQIKTELQKQGLGRKILNEFKKLVESKNIEKVYCMPYDHLEYFYGLIGFEKIEEFNAPTFLIERVKAFHQKHPHQKVILMAWTQIA